MSTNRLVVVTGGPGAGKTTLIDVLRRRGHHCVPESGRSLIRRRRDDGADAASRKSPLLFAREMMALDTRQYETARNRDGMVWFDRGVPDSLGYLATVGVAVPAAWREHAARYRYHRTVYVAPFWSDIYRRDSERVQSVDEARRTEEAIRRVYTDLGYRLVDLPLASPMERALFVEGREYVEADHRGPE